MPLDHCPKCQTTLRGDPIPEKDQEAFGGKTHFYRAYTVIDLERDIATAEMCPDCGFRWKIKYGESVFELDFTCN